MPGGEKAFEADCNCELKLVALEDGVSLLNRLRMEGKNSSRCGVGAGQQFAGSATRPSFAKSGVANGGVARLAEVKNVTHLLLDYGYFAFVYDKSNRKIRRKA